MAEKKPMPGEAPNYGNLSGGSFSGSSLEGGRPASDKDIINKRGLNRVVSGLLAGGEGTRRGRALEMRARNVEGHDKMTDKSMADIKRRKLQADAKAPGAGLYARARAKLNEVTGFKKGGSVSSASKRGDGIATKGKTKGKFV